MQETLYQTADAEVSLSDSGCRRHSIRQRMQKSLYQTADVGDTLSDSGCRRHSIRQRMQETLYQPADAGVSLLDSGCKRTIGCKFLAFEYLIYPEVYRADLYTLSRA